MLSLVKWLFAIIFVLLFSLSSVNSFMYQNYFSLSSCKLGIGNDVLYKCRKFSKSSLRMMPEGPEVLSLSEYMKSIYSGGQWSIQKAELLSGRYNSENPPVGWNRLIETLPSQVLNIQNKGKFLYFLLENDISIWNTLGLTGGWSHSKYNKHNRISIHFINNQNNLSRTMYFYDIRNFGTLKCSFSKEELSKKLHTLGPCWLTETPSFTSFMDIVNKVRNKQTFLAVFLMNQRETAGIGNYILSEVLYLSAIHPWATIAEVPHDRWMVLYQHICEVMHASYFSQKEWSFFDDTSVSANHDSVLAANHPMPSFRFHVYHQSMCPQGYQIVRQTGPHMRTIHWVPEIQVFPENPQRYNGQDTQTS